MKIIIILSLVVVVVLLLLVVVYRMYFYSSNSDFEREVIGTWTTEDGKEKLIIKKGSLTYSDEDYGTDDPCKYVIKHFNYDKDLCFLYPTKNNEMRLLGMFEKIESRNQILTGSILIHDEGVYKREFRKDWKTVQ